MKVLALVTILNLPALATAADLTKVDRTVKKEPAFTNKPRYCLLVFGPEARTRVWLVLDGDTLYVDRNGNGDLTEAGKRVAMPAFEKAPSPVFAGMRACKAGDVRVGRFTYTDLTVTQARVDPAYRPADAQERRKLEIVAQVPGRELTVVSVMTELRSGHGRANFTAVWDEGGPLVFGASPGEAPIIHVDGPLRMELNPSDELSRGDKPAELHCVVGTPGLGAGTFAALSCGSVPGLVPNGLQPVAEVEFPSANGPLRSTVRLPGRC